jgi:hypothetical protein
MFEEYTLPEEDTEEMTEDTADIPSLLDARMTELPDNQKEFLLDHLTPETLGIIGLILGDPAIEFFLPMTDMKKKIQIIDREDSQVDSDVESMTQPQEETPQEPVEVEEDLEDLDMDNFTI